MLINYFLKKPLEFKKIEDYSYFGLFSISSYILYNVLFEKYHFIPNLLLTSYVLLDISILPFDKPEMFLHHILCLFTTVPSIFVVDYNIGYNDINNIFLTETSSLFLASNYFLKKYKFPKIIYTISNCCFFVTFVYYRVYNYYINIVLNYNYLNCVIIINPICENIVKFLINVSIYGLFALNLYWLTIMLKILYKSFFNHLTIKNCEYLLQYSYLLPFIATTYGYSVYPTE